MHPEHNMRVGTNAIIIRHGHLLVVAFEDESGFHYNMPGGGVEAGESVPQALRREVREEAAAEVEVGPLALAYEYFPAAHADQYGTLHKLTLFFHCTLQDGSEPRLPDVPDPNQVGVEWLPLERLEAAPLFPSLGALWRTLVESNPVVSLFSPYN